MLYIKVGNIYIYCLFVTVFRASFINIQAFGLLNSLTSCLFSTLSGFQMQNIICLIFNYIGLSSLEESTTRNQGQREVVHSDDECCCVCLSRLVKEGEDIKVLPCLHHFHSTCVERWFDAPRKTCPMCRFLVEDVKVCKDQAELTEEMVIWYSSSFHVAGFSPF
ncbi:hypothetical protein KSS87_000289 [Heliosperma pusillum]|nr:hypothetical protein KSS87_017530 [Heliosperma pusillum]KAH9612043.1 hypothetical protein KSS87_000289 [Heliosperma pusillum]